MDEPTVSRIREIVMDRPCTAVTYAPWLTILFLNSGGFDIYTCWHAIQSGEILAGSNSQERAKVTLANLLIGQALRDISVDKDYNDLELTFTNSVVLRTFADSAEYEHWQFSEGSDMIISGPGRLWSRF
jgi:hypothetical protein